ncbi:hypothetical protein [Runella limosa]|uniref:hypothetical protein n=1 Tax=Runella limosa TaxID=370978 RepID=UPI000490E44B|nr:hypothetical protein [Runella limosa]
MTTQELFDLTADDIVTRIQTSVGLTKFAHRRAKFEGWLKVELIDILVRSGQNALPEIERIDVSFDTVGIELKTVNTNIRYPNVINTTRPITKNINGVNEDIENLRGTNFIDKFVVFIVFPITHDNLNWQVHLGHITNGLENYLYRQFNFGDNIPGVIYYGQVV